jgi:hypothetical protein
MSTQDANQKDEWEILQHGEVPGYRKTFHVILTLAVVYLIHIFVYTFFKTL